MARGLWIAAPASGAGKTLVTLALLRALRDRGVAVASVKAGPDFIDPAFHAVASGRPCFNLDGWAMRPETLAATAAAAGEGAALVIGEGVMGLFDGAAAGGGSTADLAVATGWPAVLLVDAKGMGASAAALVAGYARHRADVAIAGLIFNSVGSEVHRRILAEACAPLDIPVLGFLPRDKSLVLPERHLGLVQAAEHPALEDFLARAAAWVGAELDLELLQHISAPSAIGSDVAAPTLPPLGQQIAVARDRAFAFLYPALLESWRRQGAAISFFSPLTDEAPEELADAVYLPGGYPELHADAIAGAARFRAGLRAAAARGATIYGECGGYLVLGRGLIDARGVRHAMTDLLPIESSFAKPCRTLGYREATLASDGPLGRRGRRFRGHEFHFVEAGAPDGGEPLFSARDSKGRDLGPSGARRGAIMGSFLHLIDAWT